MVAQQEAADFHGRARAVGEAADHELLARVGLELEPGRRAGRHVGRVDALGDDAFQPQGAGRREDGGGFPREVGAEVHALDALGLDKLLEQRPPGVQRHVAQVMAGEIGQIEKEIVDAVGARRIERVLQGVEVGRAVLVQYDDLAVEPRGLDPEGLDCRGEGFELGGPVIAVAGEEASATLLDAGQQPVPVELDFIAPLSASRHARGQGGELRRQCHGQVCFDGAGQIASRLRTPRPSGRRDATARRTFLEPAQGLFDHAVGQGDHHVVLGQRPRPGVALLEEKPGFLLVTWLGDTHQFPQASQLLAVQLEEQLALGQFLARIADRFPGATVPDDDGSGTVLPGWDRAFKAAVGNRVVFDVDRHALFMRIEAGPLGHRPAKQDAVQLQAKVVVQPRGPVLLDDEGEGLGFSCPHARRLRRAREVALGGVARKRIARRRGAVGHLV